MNRSEKLHGFGHLFDSGRVVVGMNQELINDVSKGDRFYS